MKRLGKGIPRSLSIGYPVNYEGAELGNAVLAFSSDYPDVSINLRTGTHEGIYADLRSGDANIILNDQRRAFSDEYVNKILVRKPLYAAFASQDTLSDNECVEISHLRALPLIIIADESHRVGEEEYYRLSLGIESPVIFSESLDIARLMAESRRGYMLSGDPESHS